jgi:hypothetical protein
MHKNGFGQAYCQDLVKIILNKFTLYFMMFISFSMNFENVYEFSEMVAGHIRPTTIVPRSTAPGGPATQHAVRD